MGKDGTFALGKIAVRTGWAHKAGLLGWTVFHFLIRLVETVCLLLAVSNHAIWYGVAALWFVLVLLPERCLFGEKLRGFFRDVPGEHIPYCRWIKMEVQRLLRGMAYALPGAALLGWWFYARHNMSFTDFGQALERLAGLVGVTPEMGGATTTGAVMYFALVLVMALFFVWGWHRDVCVEYLSLTNQENETVFQTAAAIRKHHLFRRNGFMNFLLFIPSLLGVAVCAVPYVAQNVFWSRENLYVSLQSVAVLMKTPLPGSLLLALALVFLILYMPLWMLRKMRNAAMTVALEEA